MKTLKIDLSNTDMAYYCVTDNTIYFIRQLDNCKIFIGREKLTKTAIPENAEEFEALAEVLYTFSKNITR